MRWSAIEWERDSMVPKLLCSRYCLVSLSNRTLSYLATEACIMLAIVSDAADLPPLHPIPAPAC